ncbi:MAG TPA: peptidoglycan-binding domain-containing protein [Mycobacteriales bacterium]|nr:peptidoglycan-binding domain-containing protein [Mycobacteriales bacterium]
MQRILRGSGFLTSGTNDGIFGTATASAVRAYQTSAQLPTVDGIVGHDTWWHMRYYKVIYSYFNYIGDVYHVYGSTNDAFENVYGYGLDDYWLSQNKAASGWVDFDVNGPN